MSGSLTDFNDLHIAAGLDVVRAQLEKVLQSSTVADVDLPPDFPLDDFYDHYEPSRTLPVASDFGRWNLIDLVSHVSLIYGTDAVWDGRERLLYKLSHLRHILGRALFKEWDEHPMRKIIKGVVFEPSGDIPANTVNLFNGFASAPGTHGAVGCKRILQHIYRLCGFRDEEFEWLIRWIAYPLQNPGAKMDTSVVMHGAEGTGKSLIWELVVGRIYGEYMVTVGQQQIESQFTGWQSQKCLALCEEVVARSEKAHYKGMLKHLVTGKTLTVNEKNLPERAETNHLQFVFLSNSMTPLELDLGDRRYMVLYITDVPDQQYFNDLIAEIEGGGVAEFYRHLLDLDMKGFNGHTKPPLNAEKRDLIAAGMPNALLFYQDWKDGHLGLDYGPCPTGMLYRAYTRWCKQRNEFPRNQRVVVPEWRRHLFEHRAVIGLGTGYGDKKQMRVYVPNELKGSLRDAGFVAMLEAGCKAFAHSFDAQKDDEYVS